MLITVVRDITCIDYKTTSQGGLALNIPLQVSLLDIATAIAEKNGWQSSMEENEILSIRLPSHFGKACLYMHWHETADMLTLRIPILLLRPLPEFAVTEFCYLLNLINQRSIAGSWYYLSDEDAARVVWREEIHTDQSLVAEKQMEQVMGYCKTAFDTFYPVIATFMAEKPIMVSFGNELLFDRLGVTPEEAMKYIDGQHLFTYKLNRQEVSHVALLRPAGLRSGVAVNVKNEQTIIYPPSPAVASATDRRSLRERKNR